MLFCAGHRTLFYAANTNSQGSDNRRLQVLEQTLQPFGDCVKRGQLALKLSLQVQLASIVIPLFGFLLFTVGASPSNAQELRKSRASALPRIPVGEDAYLRWDRLPYHRIGVRAYMRSTYDRTGGNRDADASHFLYQQADDFNVALDVSGPGMLYFVRTNHHHGSPWHYEVDGQDLVVKESATDDPVDANSRLEESTFLPADLFPHPLTWTWPTTKGADLMWRPIPFEQSFRLAYSRTFYGRWY